MSCAICEIRKEKRFCPAVHGRICAQCCGEQREVTLDCPTDCPYLVQAREHEKPRSADQMGDRIDPAGLFLQVEISDRFMYEKEHLLMGLTFALAKTTQSDRSLHDHDLIAALSTLAASYERRVNSGLHYEQPFTGESQRRIVVEIENMVKEYREAEQQHTGFSSLRDSDVLKAFVFLMRLAQSRTSGRPKSRAFVEFLFAQFPPQESPVAAANAGSRIILP